MGALLRPQIFMLLCLAIPVVLVFWVFPLWYVCRKAGFSPWLTLLNCIPIGNAILLYMLAFAEWKKSPAREPAPQPVRPPARGPQLVIRQAASPR